MLAKEIIAARAAKEIREGEVVNFGIGIPTQIFKFLPLERRIFVHSENGILGMGGICAKGQEDRNLIDAGGAYVRLIPGASFFDSSVSFALVRGGRLDLAVLGALEVSGEGDLANWIIPGRYAPGIGGGMELAQKAKRVIIVTTHTDNKGRPKIVENCTLPLTAKRCVDLVITEMAVMRPTERGLFLEELADGVTIEQVREKTEAPFMIPEGKLGKF